MTLLQSAFRFLNHGPLVDRELELVPAQHRWIDELLAACRHPRTVAEAPQESTLRRSEVEHFLSEAPLGHHPGDELLGRSPSYQFWMLLRHDPLDVQKRPPMRIAGGLSLRIGRSQSIELHYGHIGYHVYPAARGHQYAARACRLVLPLAKAHGLRSVWMTCNPDNGASRKTIERLGARYVETVDVPSDDPLYARGETQKCRFFLPLG